MRTQHLRSICVALTALGLWLLTGERTYAQPVSSYTFTASTGTYTPITGTSLTSSNTANIDDQVFPVITLPFTFTYHGSPFTTVGVEANGYLKLGAAAITGYQAPSQFTDIIGGLAEDFYSLAATTGRDISYTTTGTAPNQVFTVQWTNWGFWNTGVSDVNFQIKLYEGSNQIQFVYGAMPLTSASSQLPQVGLSGSTLTDYKLLTSTTSWSAPTLATTNTAQMTLSPTVFPASGQTYTFVPPPACSGTPAGATAVISAASVCPNSPFTVSWNGNIAAANLIYQLQTSTTGVPSSYTNSGAAQTLPTFTITGGITATTYYRIVVTCTSTGGGAATSVADTVTVNPFNLCYCNANLGGGGCGAGGGHVTSVTFNTLSNLNNGCTSASNGTYTSFPATGTNTTTLVIGSTYNITVNTDGPSIMSVWIDYNQDGQWTASEHTQLTINGATATVPITVPPTAVAGITGMRIRTRGVGNTNGPTDACTNFGSGETEDYNITLVAPAPCAGTPLAGNANTTNATPCPGAQVTVNLTNGTTATGITYQLQVSTPSATAGFANLGTSNNTGIFTATPPAGNNWYRIVTTCANGGATANSVAVQVTGGSPISVLPWNDGLESVTTTGNNFPSCWRKINGDWITQDAAWTTTHDPRTGNRYLVEYWSAVNEWMMTPGFQLTAGTSYDFSFYWVGDTYAGWTGEVGVNNIQDSTAATILGAPFVTAGTTTSNTAYQQVIRSFTPTTTGTYFFGVRVNATGVPLYLGFDDFRVNVTPTCPQPTMTAATAISSNSAQLNFTPVGTAPALGYQWEVRTTGAPGSGGAASSGFAPTTATSAIANGLSPVTTYTAYVRAICSAGDSSFWSSITFTTACAPYALPFSENFNTFLPSCWSRASGFINNTLTFPTSNAWVADGFMNVGTTGAAKINLYLGTRRDWIISPTISLGATPSSYVLEFDMGVTAFANTTLDTLGSDDTVAVVISYNNGATWTSANALKMWTAADDTIGAQRYYLPFTASGDIRIGFYGSEGLVDDAPDNDIFFDSVRVSQCTASTLSLGNDTTLCGTGSITLNSGTGTSRIWSTGDTSQSIIVSQPGSYSVTVFNGSPGCSARDTINVTTGVVPVVNLGPDTAICGNILSFQLNAGNPLSTYTWSSPAADLSMFTTQIIDLGPIINAGNIANSSAPGNTAPVIVAVTNPTGCTGRDTVNVSVVFTARVSDFNITGTDPTFMFTPVLDSFTTIYNWTFGDGGTASQSTATPPVSHTYTTNGTYTVTLMVGNQCGITDTVTKTRQVTNDVKDVTADGTTITLYPNPTAADAVLTVDGSAKLRGYQVLNAAGAVVAERTLDGVTRTTLNTGAFAAGIYTLRIQLDKGVVVRKLEVIK